MTESKAFIDRDQELSNLKVEEAWDSFQVLAD